jgi:(1->4)-alpha-D-glucan 1-alpha-D-glucosylmutase
MSESLLRISFWQDMLKRVRVPAGTCRVQFNKEFTFRDAVAILPYLQQLGITDLYASPILMAAPGSSHGYDICDHSLVNPELGGEAGLDELASALKAYDMGLILDFVPNHMALGQKSRTPFLPQRNPSRDHRSCRSYVGVLD